MSLLLGLLVAAGPHSLSIEWQAPTECPGQAVVEQQVVQRLGRSLKGPFKRHFTFVIDVSLSPKEGYVLLLTEGDAQRRLVHPDCDELTRAAALAVVMAVDPAALLRKVQASPVMPPPVETVTEPPAPPPPAQRPRSRPAPLRTPSATVRTASVTVSPPLQSTEQELEPAPLRTPSEAIVDAAQPDAEQQMRAPHVPFGIVAPRLAFRAEVGGSWAALPAPGVALGFTGAVVADPIRFELTARYRVPRTTLLEGSGVSVSMVSAAVRACPVLSLAESFELPLCVGLEGGRAASDIASDGTSEASLYASAQLGLHFVWMFNHWLGWWSGVEGSVALVNYSIELPSGSFSGSRFGGAGHTGVELRVP